MNRKKFSKIIELSLGKVFTWFDEVKSKFFLSKFLADDYILKPEPFYIDQLTGASKGKIVGWYGKIKDEEASRRFGAKSLDEFSFWAWRSCGIVALQMVLRGVLDKKFKNIMELIEEGLEIGGYEFEGDLGWYHSSLIRLAQKYGLKGKLKKYLSASGLGLLIVKNNYILASVKSKKRGGHLIVVYGVRLKKEGLVEGFWIHDPISYESNGEAKYMKKQVFEEQFKGRVIMLYL